jgi:hypothetical protein
MAEPNFPVSLLTPASDLVQGDTGAEIQGIFARRGNDAIYGFDPATNNNGNQKTDVLFGDLFDNSPEEFNIIQDIQNGNPLSILGKDIPSVGKDRFVLGDKTQPYYTSFNPGTDVLGLNQFAVLYDFDPAQDTIQLNGKRKDYQLVDVNGLQVEGVSQPFSGKAIFSLQQGLPDLVAYVIAKPDVQLDLKDKSFLFVGNKPDKKPAEKKIGQLGTTGIDLAYDAATDSAGNVYITGSTSGPLGGSNQGSTDVWVAKYAPNGTQTWLKQYGTASGDTAYAVATYTDKDNKSYFYLAGSRGDDATVAKYDSGGSELWSKQVAVPGAFSATSFGLQVDDAGDVYVSGLGIKNNENREIFDFPVQDDSWVAKLNGANGTQQWFTQIKDPLAPFPLSETPFFDESYDLAVDKSGNSYLVGWTQGLAKESDPNGDLLKYDAWISKVDATGKIQWTQQFGTKDGDLEFAWAVDTDSQGNIYVTGWNSDRQNSDSYDIWLAKFKPDGTKDWTKQIGSKGDDGMFLSDLEIDAQDNIFLTGYTNDKLGKGPSDKNNNAWVARFDTEGNNKWVQQFGSKDNLDYGTGLAADGRGKLYVTGFTEALLGTDISGASGSAVDAWIAQLDVEKGKLQKFTGNAKDVVSDPNPSAVPTTDISNKIVTDEQLPSGDNIIDPGKGSSLNYGQFVSGLGIFDDPFASALQNEFTAPDGTITI